MNIYVYLLGMGYLFLFKANAFRNKEEKKIPKLSSECFHGFCHPPGNYFISLMERLLATAANRKHCHSQTWTSQSK